MQIAQETNGIQVLTPEQVEQVGGAALFGYYVGVALTWASPAGLITDIATGGALSNSVGNAVSAAENWVNGK
jgi:hypothetical protein